MAGVAVDPLVGFEHASPGSEAFVVGFCCHVWLVCWISWKGGLCEWMLSAVQVPGDVRNAIVVRISIRKQNDRIDRMINL